MSWPYKITLLLTSPWLSIRRRTHSAFHCQSPRWFVDSTLNNQSHRSVTQCSTHQCRHLGNVSKLFTRSLFLTHWGKCHPLLKCLFHFWYFFITSSYEFRDNNVLHSDLFITPDVLLPTLKKSCPSYFALVVNLTSQQKFQSQSHFQSWENEEKIFMHTGKISFEGSFGRIVCYFASQVSPIRSYMTLVDTSWFCGWCLCSGI